MSVLVIVINMSDTSSMFEIPSNTERTPRSTEHRSILASYAMRAAWQSTAPGFVDDLSESTYFISRNTHFMTGKEITADDIESIASASILVQMTRSALRNEALILRPTIPKAIGVFQATQEVFDQLDLTLAIKDLDPAVLLATSSRIDKTATYTTKNIEVAAEKWWERGSVGIQMESLEDLEAAVRDFDYSTEVPDAYVEQDGVKIESFDMSRMKNIRSRMDMLPYYKQFYEVEHGKIWLTSILEDLQSISGELK